MQSSNELRHIFLEYFRQKGHEIVATSSLVPSNDPTLLFTNAGMVQFKDVFLGREKKPYVKATSSQNCLRAGGKHNDLENVGYTARHHTFFEMLGNFSFGDYFKREAIQYAWEFLTQVLKIPAEKLWVTVYEQDQEAEDIWLKELKIDPTRFSRCGEKSNFWSMGDTGPCGPCTEIFYDHGAEIWGGPPGSPEEDGDRYVEIWNLVFMQYDRAADGRMTSLPKPSVDTGMGLERLCAVMQGVHNNYDTDLFKPMLQALAKMLNTDDLTQTSMRVIADHIRASAFLISNGVMPSNEGRGYVLRRIIRRAIRHGHKLGLQDIFFYRLVKPLVSKMGEAYPHLSQAQQTIASILKQEEEQFQKTLEQGLKIFEQDVSKLSGTVIPGSIIFKLYDTYGFPPDLTGDIARERNLSLDLEGFSAEMENQREKSQAASKFSVDYHQLPKLEETTHFVGYEQHTHQSPVLALLHDNKQVNHLSVNQQGMVVLQESPFYAESGGQVGDQGELIKGETIFVVQDTQKYGAAIAHLGYLKQGELKKGDKLEARVDASLRQATRQNHSATHLLHAALRQLLGNSVVQKGSFVDPQRLRFDFTYSSALSSEQIKEIEDRVNSEIRKNHAVNTEITTPEQAVAKGAMALFGEKYSGDVRVLSMGEFSKELCGGTHVSKTGDIGLFKIINETAIASGIRRIEAVTGQAACDYVWQQQQNLKTVAELLKATPNTAQDKLSQMLQQIKQQEKQISQLQQKLLSGRSEDLATNIIEVAGIKTLVAQVESVDIKALRQLLDHWKDKLQEGIVVLVTEEQGKVTLLTGVTKSLTEKFPANELTQVLASLIEGKGGGRKDMAQAGGAKLPAIADLTQAVQGWIKSIAK